MPVKTTIPFREGIFSITFTCTDWLPLIKIVNGYDIIYKWFDHLKAKGHFISGYVIMPNHVHALIGFSASNQDINTMIGNGKRFMAYEITDRLKADGQIDLLAKMKSNIEASRKANRKQHNVWELSFDWKHCETEAFILQKLDYFHANPCTGKWNLCVNPIDYVHSSVKFYATGEQGIYLVTGYKELLNIDLTKGN
ncbi:hypothetical protein PDL71_09970 [Lacibacter sp. MH-610]|uniref:hypothetical protein n=1 Tax=Lacibacter sp. MH-610 TaxID=3020883 RepID=UPI0038925FCC